MKKNNKARRVRIVLIRLIIFTILAMTSLVYIFDKSNKTEECFVINSFNKIVVNKNYVLPQNYVPKDLVQVNIDFLTNVTEEERYMTEESARALESMVNAASNEGVTLCGMSGYRSYETQKNLYKYNVETQGTSYADKYVAKPGASEHQIGEAMDLSTASGWIEEGCVEANWIAANSYKYGFVVRYEEGKESITGYNSEPWHVRYVGTHIAEEIYKNGITLEEFAQIN